jgi:3D (Asp-Asp-Asp) domain-containing protein
VKFLSICVIVLCLGLTLGDAGGFVPPDETLAVPMASISSAPVVIAEDIPDEIPQVEVAPVVQKPVQKPKPIIAERKRKLRKIHARVTGYCPCKICCGQMARGKTSQNTSAWVRGCAADPRAIPYWTKLIIPGYGDAVVDDTGGAMRRSYRKGITHIDVRFKTHWSAKQWGSRWMDIYVEE